MGKRMYKNQSENDKLQVVRRVKKKQRLKERQTVREENKMRALTQDMKVKACH